MFCLSVCLSPLMDSANLQPLPLSVASHVAVTLLICLYMDDVDIVSVILFFFITFLLFKIVLEFLSMNTELRKCVF